MNDLGEGGRAMISEATGRYHAAMGELRDVPWRVGRSNPRNLYADTGGGWKGHPPIGALDSPELARDAVEAHNAALNLSRLLGAGLDVLVTPCGGAGRCCGDTAGRFSVRAAKPDPAADLSVPGGVESHGHASPGEALAFARDWCEQNGIAP